MQLQPGTTLQGGKYRIERVLGQGSFGITYLATTEVEMTGQLGSMHVSVNVAIKEFFMSDLNSRGEDGSSVVGSNSALVVDYRRKFRREAENLGHLNHPNIVKVLEVFDENNTTYYAMEYIDGESLDDHIKQCGHLDDDEVRTVMHDLCSALSYMHQQGMLHLDLKPKNIMRSKRQNHIFIIDFGLSKQYTSDGEPESSTTIGLGTPGYAPIEQANYKQDGTMPATIDIYALGATLYKMLTGKTPPHASDVHNDGLPPRPDHAPEDLWQVVESCMQSRRLDRPQSMDEVMKLIDGTTGYAADEKTEVEAKVEEIEEIIAETEPAPASKAQPAQALSTATSSSTSTPQPPSKKSRTWIWVVAGIVAVAGIVIAAINMNQDKEPEPIPDEEIAEADDVLTRLYDDMVYVEGGTFTMGATAELDDGSDDDEKPTHQVTLSSFYICKHEVTQEEWEAVMGSNPSGFKSNRHPVENVSWEDCQTFISKLNSITGKNYRMPTEAEWEYAARGGNRSQGYKYSGSNNIDDVAWYGVNSCDKTHEVMTKSPNELGLYDMSGNVWEWCSDWYGDYPSSAQHNPKGASSGSNRVLRGGSWFDIADCCRVSSRGSITPSDSDSDLGLRLAL